MTLNETKSAPPLFDGLVDKAHAGLSWLARFAIAGLLIVFAGVLTVAAAVAGLVIASIALLLRFAAKGRVRAPRGRSAEWAQAEGITLEARRTDHGWRVE
ncbi:MAG: hypothetical protein AAGH87_07430 [Pseudomonadota bacterium]